MWTVSLKCKYTIMYLCIYYDYCYYQLIPFIVKVTNNADYLQPMSRFH